ncbi:hypothetical protein GCM10023215_61840 [Pseudonocardia yuanmonensis]|uniref:DUF7065 domain-containing protein n=1 Tax=Pseudonocardia yuanmonensis TaxID=1095914 RepID=A0ABP8XPX3_9PSEU
MSSYTACDHFRHHPVGDSELWQEAWLTSWYDPVTRSGGYHHVDFQPARQRACVQSSEADLAFTGFTAPLVLRGNRVSDHESSGTGHY